MNGETFITVRFEIDLHRDWCCDELSWLEDALADAFGRVASFHNGYRDKWVRLRGEMTAPEVCCSPPGVGRSRVHVTVETAVVFFELGTDAMQDAAAHAEASIDALIVNLKHDLLPMELEMHEAIAVEHKWDAA